MGKTEARAGFVDKAIKQSHFRVAHPLPAEEERSSEHHAGDPKISQSSPVSVLAGKEGEELSGGRHWGWGNNPAGGSARWERDCMALRAQRHIWVQAWFPA